MLLLARVWGDFWHVKKVYSVTMQLRVYQKWRKSLGLCVTMAMCAFTHEQPGTRR